MNNLMNNQQLHRVVTMLNREEMDFMDKLSKDALFSTGIKLSRTQILRSLVEAAKNLDINTQNINSEQTLTKKIIEIVRKRRE